MKIYFAGSIRGGRDDANLYLDIITHLKNYGEVLTEHVGDKKLSNLGENGKSDEYIYNRDLEWLLQSEVIVAEVTTPSLGVGYEIGVSVASDKSILCLYRHENGRKLSAMISGCPDVTNKGYTNIEEAKTIIDTFFNTLPLRNHNKKRQA